SKATEFPLIHLSLTDYACFVPEPGQNIHLPLSKKKQSGGLELAFLVNVWFWVRSGLNSLSYPPLLSPRFLAIFRPPCPKSYIVTFRSNYNRRPSKFIVVANNMRAAINIACEKGGPDFQVRFDKATGQAQEMKEGALRVL